EVDRGFGAIGQRYEVLRALRGETVFAEHVSATGQAIYSLAAPRATGGVIYLTKASRRGIRRLLKLRTELVKVSIYQLSFAILLTVVFGRRLVRPLERLAQAAHQYPNQPLADQRLLRRRDEIGELARAITSLATDLEQRRRATAEVGADVAHEF